MKGRSSFVVLFILFTFVLLEHRVSALRCHKCDKIDLPLCKYRLGSDKYLQLCDVGYVICTLVWNEEGVIKRGCEMEDSCLQHKLSKADCCTCKHDGCNWGSRSCNAQTMLSAKCLMILAFQVLLLFLLKMY